MEDAPGTSAEDEDALLGRLNMEWRARHLARPLAFVGFMGAGKSSLGELIAGELKRPYVDTDEEVERRGARSIADYFAAGDVPAFRALEAQVVLDLLEGPPAVLALGGGALLDARTRRALFERSFVVHLFVSWPHVRASLPLLRATRPLLQDRSESEIHELYLRRQWTYRKAHLRIDAPRTSVAEAAERVLSLLVAGEAPIRGDLHRAAELG
jgi:shikimate kinase